MEKRLGYFEKAVSTCDTAFFSFIYVPSFRFYLEY